MKRTFTLLVTTLISSIVISVTAQISPVAPAAPTANSLVITEIMYNPAESGTDSSEYIEILNMDTVSIQMAGVTFTSGVTFTFDSLVLTPNSYVLVCEDSSVMVNTYGYIGAYTWSSGALLNTGETIVIDNGSGLVLDSVPYDDFFDWPSAPDGDGNSLVLCDITSDNTDGNNWYASNNNTGKIINSLTVYASPGLPDSVCDLSMMMIYGNNMMIINNDTTPGSADSTDLGTVVIGDSSSAGFTIKNMGASDLILIGAPVVAGANSGDFMVVEQPSDTIASGDSTHFVVKFEPMGVGARMGSLSLSNNDAGADPFVFWVMGNGVSGCATTTDSISVSSCGAYTVPSGDETLTASGTYMDTIANAGGCDSIITIDLTVNGPTSSTVNASACNSYTLPSGGSVTAGGTFQDTIANAAGCDSVITVVVEIDTLTYSINVVMAEASLVDYPVGTSVSWLDCDQNHSATGDTGYVFTPVNYGNFAALVTNGTCTDTSDCFLISVEDIESFDVSRFRAHPNPTSGKLFLELDRVHSNLTVNIRDLSSRLVRSLSYGSTSNVMLTLEGDAGIYFVEVLDDDGVIGNVKVVKY